MIIENVLIDDIDPSRQLREIDEKVVSDITKSIEMSELLNPLIVTQSGERYILVAGYHRLRALKNLGWDTVPVNVIDDTGSNAEIAALVENLARAPLNKQSRVEHVQRLVELVDERIKAGAWSDRLSALTNGQKAGEQHQKGAALAVAEMTGINVRTVQRYLKSGETQEAEAAEADAKTSTRREQEPHVRLTKALHKLVDEFGIEDIRAALSEIEENLRAAELVSPDA